MSGGTSHVMMDGDDAARKGDDAVKKLQEGAAGKKTRDAPRERARMRGGNGFEEGFVGRRWDRKGRRPFGGAKELKKAANFAVARSPFKTKKENFTRAKLFIVCAEKIPRASPFLV